MTKMHLIGGLWVLMLGFILAGCGARTSGPQAWIDKPLDGSALPHAPVFIQAHASDEDGVTSIAFYIDGQQRNQASAGGGVLGEVVFEWIPEEPGSYIVEVRAVDQAGNEGPPAFAEVRIGEQVGVPVTLPTLTHTPIPGTTTPTPTPTSTPTTESATGAEILFQAVPASIQAGSCTTIMWQVENAEKVVFGGIEQPFSGSYEDCLCNNQRYTLNVTHLEGTEESRTVDVVVSGNCALPPTVTVAAPPPPPPPPPPDTTPPSIISYNAQPTEIAKAGCPGANTATVTVSATDPSGIASITVFWNVSGDIGDAALGFVGSDTYQGQAGPVNQTGTMSLFAIVQDGAGNQALTGTMTVNVLCIE